MDWSEMSKAFNSGGREVKLRGSSSLGRKGGDSHIPIALQSIA